MTGPLELRTEAVGAGASRERRHPPGAPRLLHVTNGDSTAGSLRESGIAADLAILAGREDWLASRGIDRCIGGVHLAGRDSVWRWDGTRLRPAGDSR